MVCGFNPPPLAYYYYYDSTTTTTRRLRLDEYYDYVAERMELQSRTSRATVRIGDRVRVRVESADLLERRLDFTPVTP